VPRPRNTHLRRRLAKTFVDLSTAYRDMRIELTVMRLDPLDVRALRNLMQAVLRALLAMKTETKLFDKREDAAAAAAADADAALTRQTSFNSVEDWARGLRLDMASGMADGERAMRVVVRKLGDPTRDLLAVMREALQRCDAALMDIAGYRRSFGPEGDVSSDVGGLLSLRIRDAMARFDAAEALLLDSDELPTINAQKPEVVKLFVFARHIRLAATAIEQLASKVHEMQRRGDSPRVCLPTYPLHKALKRTNAQVRHDRGGVTAGG
jgi:hypothetical protein